MYQLMAEIIITEVNHPFKTLEAARDAIKKNIQNKAIHKNIIIFLRGGNYFISKSFTLEKIDSGNKGLSINFKAYKKEKVFFIGGYNLESTDFKPFIDKNVFANFVVKKQQKIFSLLINITKIHYQNIIF